MDIIRTKAIEKRIHAREESNGLIWRVSYNKNMTHPGKQSNNAAWRNLLHRKIGGPDFRIDLSNIVMSVFGDGHMRRSKTNLYSHYIDEVSFDEILRFPEERRSARAEFGLTLEIDVMLQLENAGVNNLWAWFEVGPDGDIVLPRTPSRSTDEDTSEGTPSQFSEEEFPPGFDPDELYTNSEDGDGGVGQLPNLQLIQVFAKDAEEELEG